MDNHADVMSALRWPHAGGIWAWTALGCAAAAVLTLALRQIDKRLLGHDPIWAKPFNFAFSLAIHFATFAVIACCLPGEYNASGSLSVVAAASSIAGAMELAYISMQAARGRPSHFNGQTRWESAASVLMGVGALIVIFPPLPLSVLILSGRPPAWPSSVITGVVAGLLGGTALTLLTALRMGRLRSRYADKRPDTGRTMWLTGWSLDRADLRPAHFLATHMMQVVPLGSVLVSRLFPTAAALVLSTGLALAWAALTLHTFRQAIKGRTLGSTLSHMLHLPGHGLQ